MPWHVGIYQNDEQICGGTIVTECVVVTAAHCFSNSTDFTHQVDTKSYKVAAGKYKQELFAQEVQATQVRDVEEVKISFRLFL